MEYNLRCFVGISLCYELHFSLHQYSGLQEREKYEVFGLASRKCAMNAAPTWLSSFLMKPPILPILFESFFCEWIYPPSWLRLLGLNLGQIGVPIYQISPIFNLVRLEKFFFPELSRESDNCISRCEKVDPIESRRSACALIIFTSRLQFSCQSASSATALRQLNNREKLPGYFTFFGVKITQTPTRNTQKSKHLKGRSTTCIRDILARGWCSLCKWHFGWRFW